MIQAEQAFRASSTPLREIPLYQSFLRVSCQQVVCLPVHLWDALDELDEAVDFDSVDVVTVARLTNRLAAVFNSPPVVDVSLLQDSPGWEEPVVWRTNARQLTCAIDGHGMRDRCEADVESGYTPLPTDAVSGDWRYEGFYGELRVRLDDGFDWIVAVLAPLHFVCRLALTTALYRKFVGNV